jgi:hypothetical protein
MALHRDIYWVGRQWAVTGHGIQAVDQRLKGAFDIDAAMVWEEGLTGPLRELGWFNEADFDKALKVARERFPDPPRTAGPPAMLPACAPDPSVPAGQPVGGRLYLQGPLAKFLPQWRIRR